MLRKRDFSLNGSVSKRAAKKRFAKELYRRKRKEDRILKPKNKSLLEKRFREDFPSFSVFWNYIKKEKISFEDLKEL